MNLKTLAIKTRNRPPKTKDELEKYLRVFYGIYLASKPIEEGNSCSLDFVWDVYSTALGISDNKCFNFLGLAARGSQKTLAVATLETLLIQHDDRNLIHMASIYNQAHVCYDHFKKIVNKPLMKGVTSDPTMRETVSAKNGNKIKITTATMDAVNSFHGSLFRDELDLTPKKISQLITSMIFFFLDNFGWFFCLCIDFIMIICNLFPKNYASSSYI